ncbi:MAG: acyl-CoA dehydrogenase family protein [Betaproteobacteria bacterium]
MMPGGYTDAPLIPHETGAALDAKPLDLGLWGIDAPAEHGGQDSGALVKSVVAEELKYSITPSCRAPAARTCTACSNARGTQIARYLLP